MLWSAPLHSRLTTTTARQSNREASTVDSARLALYSSATILPPISAALCRRYLRPAVGRTINTMKFSSAFMIISGPLAAAFSPIGRCFSLSRLHMSVGGILGATRSSRTAFLSIKDLREWASARIAEELSQRTDLTPS